MNAIRQLAPSIQIARLWLGSSARGVAYLSGRAGGAKLTILPARPEDQEGENPATHVLLAAQHDVAAAPDQSRGPALDLAVLEERVSAAGNRYLAGWLSGCSIAVIRIGGAEGEPARYALRLTGKREAPRPKPRPVIDAAPEQARLPLAHGPSPLSRPSGAQAAMRARYADRPKQADERAMSMADFPQDPF